MKGSDGVVHTFDNKTLAQPYKPEVQVKPETVEVLYQNEDADSSEEGQDSWTDHENSTDNEYASENEVFYSKRPVPNWRGGKNRNPRDHSNQRYDQSNSKRRCYPSHRCT